MIHLLFTVIFSEAAMIALLLFKTPLRKLVIMVLDRLKRGRGPLMVKTVGGTILVVLLSSIYTMLNIQKRGIEDPAAVNPTDQVLMAKHLLEATLMASQNMRNVRNEYNFMRFRQPYLKHVYKGDGERFTYQECNRKFVVTAISRPSLESNPNAFNQKNKLESVKRFLPAFFEFCSPFSAFAMALSITSSSFLGVEKLADISPLFVTGVLQAMIPKMLMAIYVNGLNQICDVEIDKINKPYRPLASGAISFVTGVTTTVSCLVMSLLLGLMVGSWPSMWALILSFIIWTAYSINLPLLRWKKYPALTAMIGVATWALISPILYSLHIQTFVFKRPATFSRPLIFSIVIMGIFSIAMSFFKDIHDIEGDQAFGIQTLAARLGPKKMFWVCISLLEIAYGVALFAGATSNFYLWSRIVTGIGHAALASILLYRARSTDLKSKDSIQSLYMFIWKLMLAEFFFMPLLR